MVKKDMVAYCKRFSNLFEMWYDETKALRQAHHEIERDLAHFVAIGRASKGKGVTSTLNINLSTLLDECAEIGLCS